jgi:hypothetical protein
MVVAQNLTADQNRDLTMADPNVTERDGGPQKHHPPVPAVEETIGHLGDEDDETDNEDLLQGQVVANSGRTTPGPSRGTSPEPLSRATSPGPSRAPSPVEGEEVIWQKEKLEEMRSLFPEYSPDWMKELIQGLYTTSPLSLIF